MEIFLNKHTKFRLPQNNSLQIWLFIITDSKKRAIYLFLIALFYLLPNY